MAKRANTYWLRLELRALASGEPAPPKSLELTFDNHDELFSIIERLRAKNLFDDPAQATELAIGLKLFSEVMLRNRSNPLFAELLPAFRLFMEQLKR